MVPSTVVEVWWKEQPQLWPRMWGSVSPQSGNREESVGAPLAFYFNHFYPAQQLALETMLLVFSVGHPTSGRTFWKCIQRHAQKPAPWTIPAKLTVKIHNTGIYCKSGRSLLIFVLTLFKSHKNAKVSAIISFILWVRSSSLRDNRHMHYHLKESSMVAHT